MSAERIYIGTRLSISKWEGASDMAISGVVLTPLVGPDRGPYYAMASIQSVWIVLVCPDPT